MKRLFFILIAALSICGCSDPSQSQEEAAEAALRNQVTTESQGYASVTSFKKLNGESGNEFGVDTRRISFEATVKFRSAGFWGTGGGYVTRLSYQFVPGTKPPISELCPGAVRVDLYSEIVISGTLEGRKTDNGWQFSVASSSINPGQLQRVSQ